MINLDVTEYQVEGGKPRDVDDIRLRRMMQRDGSSKWAIYEGSRCMNRDGEWEYEPLPSSRDEDFLNWCRFDSPEEAMTIYAKHRDGLITPKLWAGARYE